MWTCFARAAIGASPDGDGLYVQGDRDLPAEIARVNLRDGRREAVRSLLPPDPAGTVSVLRIVMTPDARAYAYPYGSTRLKDVSDEDVEAVRARLTGQSRNALYRDSL